MRRALVLGSIAAAGLVLAAASASAAPPAPWRAAADVRTALSDAETELVLGSPGLGARAAVDGAARRSRSCSRHARRAPSRRVRGRRPPTAAIGRGDERGFAAARATIWTAVLAVAAERGDRRDRAAATSTAHARGCSFASSGRRPGSRAPRPTRRSRSTRLAAGRDDSPAAAGDRSRPICSTPTTAGSGRRSRPSARPRSPASTFAPRRRRR